MNTSEKLSKEEYLEALSDWHLTGFEKFEIMEVYNQLSFYVFNTMKDACVILIENHNNEGLINDLYYDNYLKRE